VIGSGPYRLVEWRSNDRLEIERWDGYPFTNPRFRRQVLKIQPDANSALLLFKKGELDEMGSRRGSSPRRPPTTLPSGRRQAAGSAAACSPSCGASLSSAPRRSLASPFIGFNQTGSNPFFGDVRVRRAMAYAFDLDRALRDAGYGLYPRSTGPFGGEHWAHDASVAPIPYDPAQARALLDEAGWRASEEDGWRYRDIDGRPVRFEFELLSSGGSTVASIADRRAEDLRAICSWRRAWSSRARSGRGSTASSSACSTRIRLSVPVGVPGAVGVLFVCAASSCRAGRSGSGRGGRRDGPPRTR
jgi:peptide/nickel transport system substrate-binding protein